MNLIRTFWWIQMIQRIFMTNKYEWANLYDLTKITWLDVFAWLYVSAWLNKFEKLDESTKIEFEWAGVNSILKFWLDKTFETRKQSQV